MSRDSRVKRDSNFNRSSTASRNAARSVVRFNGRAFPTNQHRWVYSDYIHVRPCNCGLSKPPKGGGTAALAVHVAARGFFVEPLLRIEECFEKETRRIFLFLLFLRFFWLVSGHWL